MTTQKLEQVLEYLVNEENEKATDLLHEVFVEKAKTIYSDLVESDADIEDDITEEAKDEDEEAVEEAIGGDPEERFADTIEADAEEIDAEEMFSEEDLDDEEAAEDLAGDMAPEGDGEEVEVEDAMMNVEDALAELKAAFADMMGDDVEGEEEVEGDEFLNSSRNTPLVSRDLVFQGAGQFGFYAKVGWWAASRPLGPVAARSIIPQLVGCLRGVAIFF